MKREIHLSCLSIPPEAVCSLTHAKQPEEARERKRGSGWGRVDRVCKRWAVTDVCQTTLLQTPKATEQRSAGLSLSLGSYSLAPPSGGAHSHINKPPASAHQPETHFLGVQYWRVFLITVIFLPWTYLDVRNRKVRSAKLGGMIPNLTHHLGNRNDNRLL